MCGVLSEVERGHRRKGISWSVDRDSLVTDAEETELPGAAGEAREKAAGPQRPHPQAATRQSRVSVPLSVCAAECCLT